ncbi:UDP-N-acetylmuramoyl-tripeptide--D-alanyl-D-alanine ligase [hydrothermal vent metagenome]|uniref:UDP-MurNAc-pentapeptide synthetase n=1 Tax=hydrothermal vent metagenome TaxID=652676 RepID=A0A3B1D538_9ZZZZ
MKSITLKQLLSAIGGRGIGNDLDKIKSHSLSIDSRTVQPGEIFWAIQGDRYDGHRFIEEAIERGAVAVVANKNTNSKSSVPVIKVRETTEALKKFSAWYRRSVEPFVIGVTGSVGKTTTRELVSSVLSEQFETMQSPKNYNNHIGLPLSLLRIESHHDIAMLELGASHVGEIQELADIAAPQIGIVTKIGSAHLGSFGSQQNIVQSKGELVEALPKTGIAILNGDDLQTRSLAKRATCLTQFVGENDDNHVQATDVTVRWNHLQFKVEGFSYHLNVIGRHHLTAALCAIAVGREFGMAAETIQNGFDQFKAISGRCQLQQVGSWSVVNDTYNANPTSMQAACEIAKTWQGAGKRLMIVGDMLELGAESNRYHYELGNKIAQSNIDHLFVLGKQAKQVIAGARQSGFHSQSSTECSSMNAMLTQLDKTLQSNDLIIVKGSRGMKMERVIDWLHHQMNKTNQIINRTQNSARCR